MDWWRDRSAEKLVSCEIEGEGNVAYGIGLERRER
jgi:hypothetical protein